MNSTSGWLRLAGASGESLSPTPLLKAGLYLFISVTASPEANYLK